MEQWRKNRKEEKNNIRRGELLPLPRFSLPTNREVEVILWKNKVRKASESWPSDTIEERNMAHDKN